MNDLPRDSHWTRRLRCPLTMLFTIGLIVAARWTHSSPGHAYWLGLAIAAAGQAIRIWAAGTLHKEAEVTTVGPYAWSRNPLYLGSFVIAIGQILMSGLLWSAVVIVPAFWVVYGATIRYEESRLAAHFGVDYLAYCTTVPRLIPARRPQSSTRGAFTWSQVLRNREYEALAANVIAAVVFAF